jgi:TPR repeat protein
MLSLSRRPWICCVALVVMATLPRAQSRVFAAESHPAGGIGQCQTIVRNFLARAPVVRRSNARIARLLDARRYRQAVPALRRAASDYADAWAGDTLGSLYAAGLGVPRSANTAFRWYLWSAERGDRFAQREVANAYLDGEGTKRNVAEAAYWFRIGIAPWQLAVMYYSLSQTYARGHLAPVNPRKAGYYLDKSVADLRGLAREPNGEAAYYLGLDYEHGHGVPRDQRKAVGYFCRAAALQYAPAINAIRHLREQSQ